MPTKWTNNQLKVVCYIYKKYYTIFNINILATIIFDNIRRLSLPYLGKSNIFPNMRAIERMLRRCSLLQKINKENLLNKSNLHSNISNLHFNIWHSVNITKYHDDLKLYNEPIYASNFILANNNKVHVLVLGSAYVNGSPLPIENNELFQMNFEMLPYIITKRNLENCNLENCNLENCNLENCNLKNCNRKSMKKIISVDQFNLNNSPKVVEIYTFNVLQNKNADDHFIITNLHKKYQYDSLKTYCQFYMDSIIQAASCKCATIDTCNQDDFVTYFNSIKERIESDDYINEKAISTNEILDFIEIIKPNNILAYYNPINI